MNFTLLSFCFLQSPDYSEVFGSSEEIGFGDPEMDRHSDIVAKGHTPSLDRQTETGRQESHSDSQKKADNIMDPQLLETRKRPEPPPQSAKPSLAKTRQRHLEESSGICYYKYNNISAYLVFYLKSQFMLTSFNKHITLFNSLYQ